MESKSNLDVATLKEGTEFRYDEHLYYVVGKCYDNEYDTTLIIARYLSKNEKWWEYDIFVADWFKILVKKGLITESE